MNSHVTWWRQLPTTIQIRLLAPTVLCHAAPQRRRRRRRLRRLRRRHLRRRRRSRRRPRRRRSIRPAERI
jgi:hypothetical protein